MIPRSHVLATTFAAISLLAGPAQVSRAQTTEPPADRKAAIERGLAYLRTKGQADDGTFTIQAGPGITALAVTAALRTVLLLPFVRVRARRRAARRGDRRRWRRPRLAG